MRTGTADSRLEDAAQTTARGKAPRAPNSKAGARLSHIRSQSERKDADGRYSKDKAGVNGGTLIRGSQRNGEGGKSAAQLPLAARSRSKAADNALAKVSQVQQDLEENRKK